MISCQAMQVSRFTSALPMSGTAVPVSFNSYRAGFDTGLAEGASGCTEVEIGQAGHFMLCRVQMNDGRFDRLWCRGERSQ